MRLIEGKRDQAEGAALSDSALTVSGGITMAAMGGAVNLKSPTTREA
jgi:hypothetical protein